MKTYIRIKHTGEFYDSSCYAAYAGCQELEIPVKPYKVVYSISDNDPHDPVVGTYSDVKVALEQLGVKLTPLDYPDELLPFMGRKVWKSTLFTITSHAEDWHVFVKPVEDVKRFHGTVLDKSEDLIKLGEAWKISTYGAARRYISFPSGACGFSKEKSWVSSHTRDGGMCSRMPRY